MKIRKGIEAVITLLTYCMMSLVWKWNQTGLFYIVILLTKTYLTRKRFSETQIVAFTNSTVFILHFYIYY